jgi:ACS family allantoate permease-like MFS transporter
MSIMRHMASPALDPVEDEKKTTLYRAQTDVADGTVSVIDEEVSGSDGDDALKLAGSHAHHFDEAYYKRLRWKIVSQELDL